MAVSATQTRTDEVKCGSGGDFWAECKGESPAASQPQFILDDFATNLFSLRPVFRVAAPVPTRWTAIFTIETARPKTAMDEMDPLLHLLNQRPRENWS